MPDIRNFFGGKPSQGSSQGTGSKKDESAKSKAKSRAARRVISDDEDDEVFEDKPKKSALRKGPTNKPSKPASPPAKETTTSDYFGGNNKPKRSEASKSKSNTDKNVSGTTTATPVKKSAKAATPLQTPPSKLTTNGRTSSRKKAATNYAEPKDEFGDDLDGGEDIFAGDYRKNGKVRKDDYEEGSDDDDEPAAKPRRIPDGKGRQKKLVKAEDDFVPDDHDVDMQDVQPEDDFLDPDADERIALDKPARSRQATGNVGKKRKSAPIDEDEEEDTPKGGRGSKAASAKTTPVKKKAKKDDEPENPAVQAIFDSIPTVRPPTPPARDGDSKKFDFRAAAAHRGPAPAEGSKEIPTGAENCLSGLSFVFTGILDSLGREEGQVLVKRYGGKVTTAPSSKTSYVVLGSDAGPKKLETIQKYNLKTINEDGLFELIRRLPANGGDSKAAAKQEEKKQAEAQKIKERAAEMEKEERKAGSTGSGKVVSATGKESQIAPDTRLWTVKYAPTQLRDICGNKTQVDKLQNWLRNFSKNQRKGFKLAGPDGSGVYRAVIISGPPGIGKTTAAHLVAKLEGYDIVESNASDTRSKKLVEAGLKGVLSTTSLLGYFAGGNQRVEESKKKLVLIMDEVDGMSAGDRGGVGALAAICKKTQVPIILICNDRKLPKMRPFDFCTYELQFRRPTVDQIRSRIMTIAYREGVKLPTNVVNALIEGSNADIRQVVNMISTAKLDQEAMDFDQGKQMSKAWQKHVILKPWDIIGKILGGGMFAESSKASLNDKTELYFNDHEFSYLMLQENYLGTNPVLANKHSGKERSLKLLELVDKAAESISDGDLVDRMIHGSQQQWSLMPVHAVFSFVRPASFVAGSMAGNQTRFTSWLGKNSTQGKLTRMVKEIQGHMRLRSSGDRHEVRQQYVPALWTQLVKRLELEGKDAVPDVIDLMDSYFLTKEDFDAIVELGVGPMDQEKVKTESQTKAAFTRMYNAQSHPMPFMKASNVIAPKKAVKEQPDLEEAIEESDEAEVLDDVKDEEEDADVDLTKDKYVKQPKKKAAATKKAAPQKSAGKNSKKKAKDDDDLDEDSEEDAKPKKGRGRGKGKAAGKGKASS